MNKWFCVFCVPAEGVPIGIGYRRLAGVKKTRMIGLPGLERSLTISSVVWIQRITWRTDRRTDTGRQQRARLCIATRGKNSVRPSGGLSVPLKECDIFRGQNILFPPFHPSFSERYRRYKIPGDFSQRVREIHGWGKFAIFNRNRHLSRKAVLSRKRYQITPSHIDY